MANIKPFLTVNNGIKAVEFYIEAFGAVESQRFELENNKISSVIQIEDSEFSNAEEKRTFITRFFKAFDTAITGRTVKGELIESALASIVPAEGLSVCRSIYKEVQVANNSRMPFTLVSITGTFPRISDISPSVLP